MFSYLKNIISAVTGNNESFEDQEIDEDEIFNNINSVNSEEDECSGSETSDEPLGEIDLEDLDVETFKCFRKTGTVTYLCHDYGLIDGIFYFEKNQLDSSVTLTENDEVCYLSYKAKENEMERVYKVYALKNDSWNPVSSPETGSCLSKAKPVEVISTINRTVTGMVTERKNRKVYINSLNIWCDLDKIKASFVPIEGDWVSLDATVVIDDNVADLSGDILEVKSLKPLLTNSSSGRITLWSTTKKEGSIENSVYFSLISCEAGYNPNLGDEVVYDAIESDRDGFKWRATKVIPNKIAEDKETKNYETKQKSNAFFDKNGISIVPSVCSIELQLFQSKTVTVEVTNNGNEKKILKNSRFLTKGKSQLKLKTPKESDSFSIKPKQTKKFYFKCEGQALGLSAEVFLFNFKNFVIARKFEINVVSNAEMNKFLDCSVGPVIKYMHEKENSKQNEKVRRPERTLYGPKVWSTPKFISKEPKCVFKVPKKLLEISKKGLVSINFRKELENYAPYLLEDLNFDNYRDRFHMMLYLEEIVIRRHLKQYDMTGVYLVRNDEFLVLTVPGLVEKRPSLVVGDKIAVTQPWSEKNKTKQVGIVHDILEKEVFLKFHRSFHETYDETKCDVSFEPNVNFFSKCHQAVNRAVKTHGASWLFPSSVNEKPPSIDFEIPEDDHILISDLQNPSNVGKYHQKPQEPEVNGKKSLKKKLIWANKDLNERQKLAVVNVLKAQGRPLPYIIFGPPGTGKTVTLVEIIIQIYRFSPESRILVATPSNSSADLICERLIDMEKLKPGELVRLLALYRVIEGLVPAKLLPYSTFFGPLHTFGKNCSEIKNKDNIQPSTLNELAGMHKITVATCVTNGIFHHYGLGAGHFTHIIVDEAGQTSEPELLMTTTFQNAQAGQIILAGDPQQLGPMVCSPDAARYGYGVSLLKRLISVFPYAQDYASFPKTSGFDPRFVTQLLVNYRTVPEILTLASQMFYNSDLIPSVSQTEGFEAEIIKKFNFKVENRKEPPSIIFHGIVGQNYQDRDSPSWFNPHEVWQCVIYLRQLYDIGLKSKHIGIVSPYAQQVKKIRNLLTSLELAVPKIGSVEEFQGQERHVIILTTVRSSPKHLHSDLIHSLGFVASPQRLNVALTRAKALLIIIGNPFLLLRDPYWENVVMYCQKNNSYVGCSLNDEIIEEEEDGEETDGDDGSECDDDSDLDSVVDFVEDTPN